MMFIPYEEYKLDAWWKNQIHCYHLKKKLPSINLFWGSNMFYIGFEDKLQRIVYTVVWAITPQAEDLMISKLKTLSSKYIKHALDWLAIGHRSKNQASLEFLSL